MNSHTSVGVKGWSIGLVTASVDGESQLSKEVMNYIPRQIVWKDLLLGYLSSGSNESGAVIMLLNSDVQNSSSASLCNSTHQ